MELSIIILNSNLEFLTFPILIFGCIALYITLVKPYVKLYGELVDKKNVEKLQYHNNKIHHQNFILAALDYDNTLKVDTSDLTDKIVSLSNTLINTQNMKRIGKYSIIGCVVHDKYNITVSVTIIGQKFELNLSEVDNEIDYLKSCIAYLGFNLSEKSDVKKAIIATNY